MSKLITPDEVLHFPNHTSIEISYANTQTYSKCKSYDSKAMAKGFVWHQVVVQHGGRVRGMDAKTDLLKALFDVVDGEEFYPVAYRRGQKEDRFLVRQCQAALDKLFANSLRIKLRNDIYVTLQVQLNVAEYSYGQLSTPNQIAKVISDLYNRMERVNGEDGILNLSHFGRSREFNDCVVNLGNRGVFERVCNFVCGFEKFRNVNGILLSGNDIATTAPLHAFAGVDFAILDLRDNKLVSGSRLCRDLKAVKADALLLAGNPITNSPDFPECLRPIFKNFKKIDGIPVENLSKDYTPIDSNVDSEQEGYRIDRYNKADIHKFENSTDWHAFMIPDEMQEYSKDEIFDYFFITVSPTLSDIYPCYYKYTSGEHQFLVRKCFDQIKYLVENCNMEIKIPRLVAPPPPNDFTTDFTPGVQMDNTIAYYLRMNISPFKRGQVDVLQCIEKALTRRFSAMDRMLNLSNFQSIEGLENIVINLSSPKILNRVLMQASRKFLTSCIELRLAQNKILNANFSKVLTLMGNLKAIDLGNNWIHDLSDIKDLSVLGLKSLRLDGNPLCGKYSFAGEYIKAVKQIFPDLNKLDNIEITSMGHISSQKNFLVDVGGYDFVEQFVTRYFKTFESNSRSELREMYHPKCVFSMTCNFHVAKMTAENYRRISKYSDGARNILKMSDFSRSFTSVYVGPDEIMTLLVTLPNVTYDMLTFTTDTTIFNEHMVVITINGVYLDQAPTIMDTDILMGFARTFVLKPVQYNMGTCKGAVSYQIINDQLNIFNPTPTQAKNAFKYFKCEDTSKNEELTVADKEALLIMLQEVTKLKSIWCTRCLEDSNWDFQRALELFLDLCVKKEVPDTAFI